ncbi:ribonuclease H-like domain-containing protein [Tanacetum coccineum]
MWATAMKIALKGKNKMGFINGQVYSEIASEVWTELKETYDKMDGCYESIGYPTSFVRNPNMSKESGNTKSLNNAKPSPSSNMSDANQHMTESTKDMFNFVDISSLMLTVSHPNATLAKITTIASLRLTSGIVLFDVLVVLEYNDLKLGKIMGTGSEIGGLYYLMLIRMVPYRVTSKDGYKSKRPYDEEEDTSNVEGNSWVTSFDCVNIVEDKVAAITTQIVNTNNV